jgi:hypothetical protein
MSLAMPPVTAHIAKTAVLSPSIVAMATARIERERSTKAVLASV